MPIDKRAGSAAEALADVSDGATVLISGFGGAGFPNVLIRALRDRGPRDLHVPQELALYSEFSCILFADLPGNPVAIFQRDLVGQE